MPQGYLVQLGDGVLDDGDSIVDPNTSFTTDRSLGQGQWTWSGTVGDTTYTNETEPGEYFLATNGNVYFVPAYGPVDSISSAEAENPPTYPSDGVVTGSGGDDTIDSNYEDGDGDSVGDGDDTVVAGGGNDTVSAGAGNDTVDGGEGDDTIEGNSGNDTIDGGAGDDTIHGGSGADTIDGGEGHDDIDGGNGGDTIGGGAGNDTIDGGGGDDTIYGDSDAKAGEDVTITSENYAGTSDGYSLTAQNVVGGQLTSASSDNVGVYNGTFGASGTISDSDSSVSAQIGYDKASGLSENITVNLDAPTDSAQVSFEHLYTSTYGEVGHWAIYKDGNLVAEADFTEQGSGSGSGTLDLSGYGEFDQIVMTAKLQTDGTDGSDYTISGITFTPEPQEPGEAGNDTIDGGDGDDVVYGQGGDDTIDGGTGDDELHGGSGDDTIHVGEGDTATGGSGDDMFIITDYGESGSGTITITGGDDGETNGDTLNFNGLLQPGTLSVTDDGNGTYSGTATLSDGSTVNFSGIENVVCFTTGTRIATPYGPRSIDDLKVGDLVLTRENGPQPIRWKGSRTVRAEGKFAPIRFEAGAMGNTAPLLVSPQHRLLSADARNSLLFGEREVLVSAWHLINGTTVQRVNGGEVTYVHMLFDRHELVFAEDCLSESFFPGETALGALHGEELTELFALYPELRSSIGQWGETARTCLNRKEGQLLAAE